MGAPFSSGLEGDTLKEPLVLFTIVGKIVAELLHSCSSCLLLKYDTYRCNKDMLNDPLFSLLIRLVPKKIFILNCGVKVLLI